MSDFMEKTETKGKMYERLQKEKKEEEDRKKQEELKEKLKDIPDITPEEKERRKQNLENIIVRRQPSKSINEKSNDVSFKQPKKLKTDNSALTDLLNKRPTSLGMPLSTPSLKTMPENNFSVKVEKGSEADTFNVVVKKDSDSLPAINSGDEKYTKYINMLKVGVPKPSVEQKMITDGLLSKEEIDNFLKTHGGKRKTKKRKNNKKRKTNKRK